MFNLYALNPVIDSLWLGQFTKKEQIRYIWNIWDTCPSHYSEDYRSIPQDSVWNWLTVVFHLTVTNILGAPKSLQMVIAAMKLKDAYSLEGKLWPT